jgi:hypothetical protein
MFTPAQKIAVLLICLLFREARAGNLPFHKRHRKVVAETRMVDQHRSGIRKLIQVCDASDPSQCLSSGSEALQLRRYRASWEDGVPVLLSYRSLELRGRHLVAHFTGMLNRISEMLHHWIFAFQVVKISRDDRVQAWGVPIVFNIPFYGQGIRVPLHDDNALHSQPGPLCDSQSRIRQTGSVYRCAQLIAHRIPLQGAHNNATQGKERNCESEADHPSLGTSNAILNFLYLVLHVLSTCILCFLGVWTIWLWTDHLTGWSPLIALMLYALAGIVVWHGLTLLQKLLDSPRADRQKTIVASLCEGSRIRSIEEITVAGVHFSRDGAQGARN